jgi:hypothetical protein
VLRTGETPSHVAAAANRPRQILAVALAASMAGLVTAAASVRYALSDPSGSLLVTQQLILNRTVALDAYAPDVLSRFWTFTVMDGGVYYYWPLGSSLSSIPFVAAFMAAGLDIVELEPTLQIVIATVLAGLTVALLYVLARLFLSHRTSLVLATAFWFATSLASVTGTALWSMNWAVLYGTGSLILAVGAVHRRWRWAWAPLAATLAMGYVVRPTMAQLVLVLLGYLAVTARRVAALTALGLGACAVAWLAFSVSTYASWTPPYYRPDRLGGTDLWLGLAGALVSPGRGLLVFLPVLLVIPLLVPLRRHPRWRDPVLTWAMAAWLVLSALAVASFVDWYGGWSYGPRLLTEVMPAVFLLLVLLWPDTFSGVYGRAVLALVLAFTAWGFYVHTVQGLFNPWTQRWNWSPDVNTNPDTLWDWRYPPFLHSEQRHADRLADYEQ